MPIAVKLKAGYVLRDLTGMFHNFYSPLLDLLYNICCIHSCVDKVTVKTGRLLYRMTRDDMRDMCGFGEGTRLFSHLQRDKPKVLIMH